VVGDTITDMVMAERAGLGVERPCSPASAAESLWPLTPMWYWLLSPISVSAAEMLSRSMGMTLSHPVELTTYNTRACVGYKIQSTYIQGEQSMANLRSFEVPTVVKHAPGALANLADEIKALG